LAPHGPDGQDADGSYMGLVMERREFLASTLKTAGAVGLVAAGGYVLIESGKGKTSAQLSLVSRDLRVVDYQGPGMVIVRGNDPAEMTRRLVAAMGGMESFVQRGDRVLLKPNVAWDRPPELAACTNPEVVGALVSLCVAAGAAEVVVTDVTCNNPERTFQRSGIAEAAEAAGGRVIIPGRTMFSECVIGGEVVKEWPIYEPLLRADKLINVPIVKHHSLALATVGMKNWFGVMGGARNRLHQRIDQSIVDISRFVRPTLIVVDAVRVLKTNGPQGGRPEDVAQMNTMAGTVDQVAADAFGSELLGLDPPAVGYVRMGHEQGLGNMDYRALKPVTLEI
jgi:uncharacterized protein (DUF362 family)